MITILQKALPVLKAKWMMGFDVFEKRTIGPEYN